MFLEQHDLSSKYLQLGRAPVYLLPLLHRPVCQSEMYVDPFHPTGLEFPHCATIHRCVLLGFR